ELSDTVTLGMSGFVADSDVEFDNSTTDPAGEQFVESNGLRVFAEIYGDSVDSTIAATTFVNDRYFPVGFTQNFRGERQELSYVGTTRLGMADVSFGAEYSVESYTSDFEAGEARVASVFGEVLVAPNEDLDLSFSLRGDKSSEFAGTLNARAALAWRAAPGTIVRAVASTGTRNPSLYELFGFFGNPALTPETSRSLEAGVERQYDGGGFVKATLFKTDIDDLITYDFPTNAYAQVGGTTQTSGLELSGAMPIGGAAEVFGNYTYTRAETNGSDLVRVPTHELAVGVGATLMEGLRGELSLRHVADFTDFDAVTFALKDMEDFTVVNAALTYEIAEGQEAYIRVENLFDEDYQVVDGYNQPGRSVYVGFRATF
ncbi:MAG: TonB-dependent receptor, partial [Pseudomonadota bacterium]